MAMASRAVVMAVMTEARRVDVEQEGQEVGVMSVVDVTVMLMTCTAVFSMLDIMGSYVGLTHEGDSLSNCSATDISEGGSAGSGHMREDHSTRRDAIRTCPLPSKPPLPFHSAGESEVGAEVVWTQCCGGGVGEEGGSHSWVL